MSSCDPCPIWEGMLSWGVGGCRCGGRGWVGERWRACVMSCCDLEVGRKFPVLPQQPHCSWGVCPMFAAIIVSTSCHYLPLMSLSFVPFLPTSPPVFARLHTPWAAAPPPPPPPVPDSVTQQQVAMQRQQLLIMYQQSKLMGTGLFSVGELENA